MMGNKNAGGVQKGLNPMSKPNNVRNSSQGRVMKEGNVMMDKMARPSGRTGYTAGPWNASTNAKC